MIELAPAQAKRRDELAKQCESTSFKYGYNICHADMLPVLEQMAEALEWYTKHSKIPIGEIRAGAPSWAPNRYRDLGAKARAALAAYHAWRGSE